jgi:microcystin-dependent protein
MAYTPTTWTDEIPGATPVKYTITDDTLGEIAASATIELATAPTAGTPVNATNLNNIEDGIVTLESDLDDVTASLATYVGLILGDMAGVLSGLAVSESSPAAQSVTVAVGKVYIRGIGREVVTGDSRVLTINSNTSGNPRIDVIVARADWTTSAITLAVLEGTPAASPVAPTLTQTDGVLWEEALAEVAVADGFSSIVDANITDWRRVLDLKYDTGDLKPLLVSTVPDGWLIADGTEISRTRYADLFSCIGTTFGVGDGSTTFELPDLRGRVFAGKDNMGGASADIVTDSSADSIGGCFGAETHTLSEAEMPVHTHNQHFTDSSGDDGGETLQRITPGTSAYTHQTGTQLSNSAATNAPLETSSTGSGDAHNNMQPTMFGNVIIKT